MTTSDDGQDVLLFDHSKYEKESGYQELYRKSRNAMYWGIGCYLGGVAVPAAIAMAASDNPSLTQRAVIAFSSLATGLVAYLAHGWFFEQSAEEALRAYVRGRHAGEMKQLRAAAVLPPALSIEPAAQPSNVIPLEARVTKKSA